MKARRILITGANGYVGNFLTSYFSHSYTVFATARDIERKIIAYNVIPQKLDILSRDQARKVISAIAPDIVIHAAALPKRSTASDDEFIRTNVDGIKNIALATKHFSQAKFIMISSGCAFKQEPNRIITLASPRDTSGAFARSKNLAEITVASAFGKEQHRVAVVYPPVILHPIQSVGIIPTAVYEAKRCGMITNKVPHGHVNFVHHAEFSRLLEAITHDSPNMLRRYLLTGNRFSTVDFFKKLQYIFANKLNLRCSIKSVVDPHLHTMCEADESKILLDFPRLKREGDIDDIIHAIAKNHLKKIRQNSASTVLVKTQLYQSTPVPPSWIPKNKADILLLEKDLSRQERDLLKAAEKNIAEFFIETRKKMLATKMSDNDFPYFIFEPVLKKIILGMTIKFEKELLDKHSEISHFMTEAISLLAEKIPYKKTMRFVVSYLHYLDEVFLKVHPGLSSNFHRHNAEHVFENLLESAPNVLLFPSFQEVNIDYFLNTRPAPFHIVGLDMNGLHPDEKVPYADGFAMKISEYFWHDVGHIEFMQNRDREYIQKTFKPIERVIPEWNFTRRRIADYLKSIQANINLLDATKLILFELLHERGFQYSLAVLKAELNTPKWIEILNRKFKNNYYKNSPEINLSLFAEIDHARAELLKFVNNLRCKDQKAYIKALHGEELPMRVTHFPQVSYGQGFLQNIIIDKSGIYVSLQNKYQKIIRCKISELILAQVNPIKATPFDKKTRNRIEMVFDKALDVHCVVMSLDKTLHVLLHDGRKISLQDFVPHPQEKELSSKNRYYFELEQVLGSHERGELISYTHQEKPHVYFGTVHHGFKSKIVEIRNNDKRINLSLSEILVDPMQKEDFVNEHSESKEICRIRSF